MLASCLLLHHHVQDVAFEAAKWGGRILLHQEVFTSADGKRPPSCQLHSAFSGGLPPPFSSNYAGLSISIPGRPGSSLNAALPAPMVGSFLTPPVGPVPATAVQLSAAIASPAVAAAAAGVGQVPPTGNWQQQQQRGNAAGLPPLSPVPPVASTVAANGGAIGFPGFKAINTSPTAVATAAVPAASPAAAAAVPAPSPAGGRGSSSQFIVGADGTAAASNTGGDCITAPVDVRPGAAVVPFWETVDLSNSGDSDQQQTSSGKLPLATCLEVAKQLQAAGFHITYRRIPLSRERTPVPGDLSDMLKQMLALPAGVGPLDRETPGGGASPNATAMMREAAEAVATTTHWAAAASKDNSPQKTGAAGDQQDKKTRSIVHLVVSRTAVGSSARFATATVATFLAKHTRQESKAAASQLPQSPTSSPQGPAAKRMRRTHSDLGEYRGIMSLVRLLPGGSEVKAQVDEAIDRCSAVGNLRDDIKACKHSAEAAPGQSEDPFSTAWAARQLGVHYLKRYFLLIAFR